MIHFDGWRPYVAFRRKKFVAMLRKGGESVTVSNIPHETRAAAKLEAEAELKHWIATKGGSVKQGVGL